MFQSPCASLTEGGWEHSLFQLPLCLLLPVGLNTSELSQQQNQDSTTTFCLLVAYKIRGSKSETGKQLKVADDKNQMVNNDSRDRCVCDTPQQCLQAPMRYISG